jgi:hypothetical protein
LECRFHRRIQPGVIRTVGRSHIARSPLRAVNRVADAWAGRQLIP